MIYSRYLYSVYKNKPCVGGSQQKNGSIKAIQNLIVLYCAATEQITVPGVDTEGQGGS